MLEHAKYMLRLTKVVRNVRAILAAEVLPSQLSSDQGPLTGCLLVLHTQVNLVQLLQRIQLTSSS